MRSKISRHEQAEGEKGPLLEHQEPGCRGTGSSSKPRTRRDASPLHGAAGCGATTTARRDVFWCRKVLVQQQQQGGVMVEVTGGREGLHVTGPWAECNRTRLAKRRLFIYSLLPVHLTTSQLYTHPLRILLLESPPEESSWRACPCPIARASQLFLFHGTPTRHLPRQLTAPATPPQRQAIRPDRCCR